MKKIITKISLYYLHYYLIILLSIIPISSLAQNVIDTSAPEDLLIEPTLVVPWSSIEPNCNTYTGCGLIVIQKHYYHKPKKVKLRRQCVYEYPCCVRNC